MIDARFLMKMWCSVGEGYYRISSIQLKNLKNLLRFLRTLNVQSDASLSLKPT